MYVCETGVALIVKVTVKKLEIEWVKIKDVKGSTCVDF